MTTTISNIGNEIENIISKSKNINPKISEQERINKFLDTINNLRDRIIDRTSKLEELDDLFTRLTWLNIEDKKEEDLLKQVIDRAKKFHSRLIRNYANLKRNLWKENICRNELENYKYSIEDFEDSIFEVEEIFFSLRKDEEFNDLVNS
tara:strand:- start:474 stop:920 length:447 start_codon:yes stop_codon:yes gene_type:complete